MIPRYSVDSIMRYPQFLKPGRTPPHDFEQLFRKVASILTFCYSEPLPYPSLFSGTRAKEKIRELNRVVATIGAFAALQNNTSFEDVLNGFPRPGVFYPPLSTDSEITLQFNKFDRLESYAGSLFTSFSGIRTDCEWVIRNQRSPLGGVRRARPSIQAFTETYNSILKGEFFDVRMEGLIPIIYRRQPVVAGKPNPKVPNLDGGSLSAATQYFSEGLQMNQLLFLTNNRDCTYESKSPSTSFGFLFRISHENPDYCLMKLTNGSVRFYVFKDGWDEIRRRASSILEVGSSTWAQGDSVFLFEWGDSIHGKIKCLNYGVEPFTVLKR